MVQSLNGSARVQQTKFETQSFVFVKLSNRTQTTMHAIYLMIIKYIDLFAATLLLFFATYVISNKCSSAHHHNAKDINWLNCATAGNWSIIMGHDHLGIPTSFLVNSLISKFTCERSDWKCNQSCGDILCVWVWEKHLHARSKF